VRPLQIVSAMRAKDLGEPVDEAQFERQLGAAVAEVVRRQVEVGIDIPSDGEFGKSGWSRYLMSRFGGLAHRPLDEAPQGLLFVDRARFSGFYAVYENLESSMWVPPGQQIASRQPRTVDWECTEPITYRGDDYVARDIANFKAALAGLLVADAFIPCAAPCSVNIVRYKSVYKDQEAFVFAAAEALRSEYQAIVDAGFVLQVDDALLPSHYDPNGNMDDYLRWAEVQVQALNHALRDIPEERVRYHICWGSQNVPHTWDVPLEKIVRIILKVKAQAYAIEAANPRHEHEWRVWESVKLPEGKILIPGMVSHSTNIVEHPELIAWRIENFANLLGRENVIAGTDCGFSQNWNLPRVHAEIQWAKLQALAEGAKLASKRLWAATAASFRP